MKIIKSVEGSKVILVLDGRLDTTTAPELEAVLKEIILGLEVLILDFAALDYISSSGLRVILSAQKQVNTQKSKMLIQNVNETILEVFEVTGFVDILTIV